MASPSESNDPRSKARTQIESQRKDGHHRSRFDWKFVLTVFLAVIPLLAIVGVLLGLIFGNRVHISPLGTDDSDGGAYYVNFDSTKLITLASWASSWSPYVAVAIMGLLSTLLSHELRRESELDNMDKLPTPWQLSLLMQLLNGKLPALWTWAPFHAWRRRERPLPMINSAGAILLCATILQCAPL